MMIVALPPIPYRDPRVAAARRLEAAILAELEEVLCATP